MAIDPTRPSGNARSDGWTAKSAEQKRMEESVKRASQEILSQQKRVEEAQIEAERRIEALKNEEERQLSKIAERSELIKEQERTKGYQAIRDVQRNQQQELTRMRRVGEDEIDRLGEYYRSTIDSSNKRGEAALDELKRDQFRQAEYERTMSQTEIEQMQADNRAKMLDAKEKGDQATTALLAAQAKEYERLTATSEKAKQEAESKFQENYTELQKGQQETLNRIQQQTSSKIDDIKKSHASKLALYYERSTDPFYQMRDMQARLFDEGDHFLLEARVPEHEQPHITVTMKGNRLVLSGSRRNDEKVELTPGHTVGTASYQSFQESFAIDWPVDTKQIRKSFDGDQVQVIIPKKSPNGTGYKPHKAKEREITRVERPQFPKEIEEIIQGEQAGKTPASKRSPGSGTVV